MIKKVKDGYKVVSEKKGKNLGGPYKTREEAAHALDKVRERNEAWDKQE